MILRLLKKADQTTKDEVEELMNGGRIKQRMIQELTYRDVDDSVENVWSVLYAAGYLTGKHVEQGDAETGEGYSDISIQTPERVGVVIELKYANEEKSLVRNHRI